MHDDFPRWRAEDEARREIGAGLLAHFEAEKERDRAQTEALLEQLTSGLDADPNDHDHEETE